MRKSLTTVIYILTSREALHSTRFRNQCFFESARTGCMCDMQGNLGDPGPVPLGI